jgi:general secretion pathway protein G
MKHRPTARGFTLIELLIVIVIIAILASLSFSGIQALRARTTKTKAQVEMGELVVALKSYRADSSMWPNQKDGDETTAYEKNIVDLLGPLTNNSRKRVYIQLKPDRVGSEGYMDPWGRAYQVMIDKNNDGIIAMRLPGGATTNVTDSVAVLSKGMEPDDPGSWIFSWK